MAAALSARRNPLRVKPIPRDVELAIARVEKNDKELVELNLGGRDITLHGFKRLGQALKTNRHLKHLLIYNTFIDFHGMQYLAEGLKENRTVTAINLGENTLSAETVDLLVDLIEHNPCILSLYLDWGVTNNHIKKHLNKLLDINARVGLYQSKYGSLPKNFLDDLGHHAGFRGANRNLDKSKLQSLQKPNPPVRSRPALQIARMSCGKKKK